MAQQFADPHSNTAAALDDNGTATGPDSGVVLETVAQPAAILLMREKEGYYDEGEIVVDPFRLNVVIVASGHPRSQS